MFSFFGLSSKGPPGPRESANTLRVAGRSAQSLKTAGYTALEAIHAGYAMSDITAAGYTAEDFNNSLREAVAEWKTNRSAACQRFGPIATWNVSEVTSMQALFRNDASFNEDLSAWDVRQVRDMRQMFEGAAAFQPQCLVRWAVSPDADVTGMFSRPLSRSALLLLPWLQSPDAPTVGGAPPVAEPSSTRDDSQGDATPSATDRDLDSDHEHDDVDYLLHLYGHEDPAPMDAQSPTRRWDNDADNDSDDVTARTPHPEPFDEQQFLVALYAASHSDGDSDDNDDDDDNEDDDEAHAHPPLVPLDTAAPVTPAARPLEAVQVQREALGRQPPTEGARPHLSHAAVPPIDLEDRSDPVQDLVRDLVQANGSLQDEVEALRLLVREPPSHETVALQAEHEALQRRFQDEHTRHAALTEKTTALQATLRQAHQRFAVLDAAHQELDGQYARLAARCTTYEGYPALIAALKDALDAEKQQHFAVQIQLRDALRQQQTVEQDLRAQVHATDERLAQLHTALQQTTTAAAQWQRELATAQQRHDAALLEHRHQYDELQAAHQSACRTIAALQESLPQATQQQDTAAATCRVEAVPVQHEALLVARCVRLHPPTEDSPPTEEPPIDVDLSAQPVWIQANQHQHPEPDPGHPDRSPTASTDLVQDLLQANSTLQDEVEALRLLLRERPPPPPPPPPPPAALPSSSPPPPPPPDDNSGPTITALQRQVHDVQGRNAELEAQMAALQDTLHQETQKYATLHGRCFRLRERLTACEGHPAQLEALKHALAQETRAHSEARQRYDAAWSDHQRQHDGAVASLRGQLDAVTQQLAAASERLRQDATAQQTDRHTIAALQQTLHEEHQQHTAVTAAHQALARRFARLTAKHQRYEGHPAKIKALREALAQEQRQYAAVRFQFRYVQHRLQTFKREPVAHATAVRARDERLTQLQTSLQHKTTECAKWQRQFAAATQRQDAALSEQRCQYDARQVAHQATLAALQATLQHETQQRTTLQAALEDLAQRHRRLTETSEGHRDTIDALTASLETQRQQTAAVRAEKEELLQSRQTVNATLDALTEQLETALVAHLRQYEELQTAQQNDRHTIAALQASLRQEAQQHTTLRAAHQALARRFARLTAKHQRYEGHPAKIKALREALAQEQRQYAALHAEHRDVLRQRQTMTEQHDAALTQHQETVTWLTDAVQQAQRKYAALAVDHEDLEQRCTRLTVQVQEGDGYPAKIEALTEALAKAQRQHEDVRKERQTIADQRDAITEQHTALQAARQDLEQRYHSLMVQHKQRDSEMQTLTRALERKRSHNTILRCQYRDVKGQLQALEQGAVPPNRHQHHDHHQRFLAAEWTMAGVDMDDL